MTAVSRSLALPFLLLTLGVSFSGCTTAAVAVDQCREIESARCKASVPCGIVEPEDVEECQNFYFDQCLHGIQGPEEPTSEAQDECVGRIEDAGADALAALLAAELAQTEDERNDALKAQLKACVVVALPWNTKQCSFIKAEEKGMGGMGGKSQDEE